MKDKLEKTGHRKRYYQFRYFVVAFLFVLTAVAASAIPVGISIQLAEAEARAENRDESSLNSETSSPFVSDEPGKEPLLHFVPER